MCGIYGISMKTNANKQKVLANIKILGLYNLSRGKDSSGIYINKNIYKTLDEFDDMLKEIVFTHNIELDNNTLIMGHNRAGSMGYKKTINEAQPFKINDSLIFTHNGTLKSTYSLSKDYDLKESDFKTDSEMLGHILDTKGTDVLKVYKGAAALAYSFLDKPNSICLFHGKSRDKKDGTVSEERPLYYLVTEDGIYYSSLESSLKAIRDNTDQEVKNLKYNVIITITNGEFEKDSLIEIDREDANIHSSNYADYEHDDFGYGCGYYDNRHSPVLSRDNRSKTNITDNPFDKTDYKLVFKESYPIKVLESASNNFKLYNNNEFVYYHFGRYYTEPKVLADGPIYIKKGGIICATKEDSKTELYFFHKGVMMKDEKAYREVLSLKNMDKNTGWFNLPKSSNFAFMISKYSMWPVCNLASEINTNLEEKIRFAWYTGTNNSVVKTTDKFCPKFSGRCYNIKEGILFSIKASQREKTICDSMFEVQNQLDRAINVKSREVSLLPAITFPKEDTDKFLFFYEKVFKNLEDINDDIGDDESKALSEFVKFTFHRDLGVEPSKLELSESIGNIVNNCIRYNYTLEDYVESEYTGDGKLIAKFYEKVLDNKKDINNLKMVFKKEYENLGLNVSLEDIDKMDLNDEDIDNDDIDEDEEFEKSDVYEEYSVEIIEDILLDFEDIRVNIGELVKRTKSTLSQESATKLILGTTRILKDLLTVFEDNKSKDLINRTNKLLDSKIHSDGIL